MDDVRVVEPGAGARLARETLQRLLVVNQILFHQLHRHHAFQHHVPCAVDRAHATGGDFAAQLKLPQNHRHHDCVAALLTRLRCQRRQIARDKRFGVATRTGDHLQGSVLFAHAISI